ncbi:hypothetical protein [Thiomicrospira cyclica]|uniref:Uncharacterized protein n=1 Tax=Thiomicrospira cyclica (strain DSM 14477 / JCM 11371 / ALM1) TaxID=717773 RepID=F6D8X9_THICA|nr:hypothetical protein [Thiomicrospira cyclica]AEG31979.1 hypothetical protein Thicy_1212 [Thiomicrospira cyclica ALM1]
MSRISGQSPAALIFGGILMLIYPSLLTLEKPMLFLTLTLLQLGLLVLAFYQLDWAIITHVCLLLVLIITSLKVRQ